MEYVEHACAGPELMKGSHAEDVGTGVDTLYIREPLGPFVFLPPFNFPAMIALYYVWALAAGQHGHHQGSRLCPMTITRILRLPKSVGFPKGVINLLHGFWQRGRRGPGYPSRDSRGHLCWFFER